MKKIIFFLILSAFLFSGCSNNNNKIENTKDTIAVSIIPEETFVKAIVKDKFDIVTLIPPGSSPASHSPTPANIEALKSAKIYFTIGVATEKANILPLIENDDSIKKVNLNQLIEDDFEPRYFDKEKRAYDSHIWLSVKRSIKMVNIMKEELIKIYPEDKEFFNKNATDYIAKLKDLDVYISSKRELINNDSFIIFHPSYGYYSEDYNLNMIAIEKNGKEASIKRLETIINIAKSKNINNIFVQDEMSKKQAKIISDEINGNIIELKPLSSNYIINQKLLIDSLVGE